jgi:hypothetical protein
MKPERKLPARFLVAHSAFGEFIAHDRDTVEWVADQLRQGVFEHRQVIEEGTFLDLDTRAPKSDKVQAQLRALLLGTDADLRPNTSLTSNPSLYLIPDWWPACAVMQLTGPAKAGKTYVVVDIIRTLVDPDWAFLGRWRRGSIVPEELERGIVLINTEVPGIAMERLLAPLGDVGLVLRDGSETTARELVTCYSLRDMAGGPSSFDLTDPEKFEQWSRVLTQCDACEGNDNVGPFAVIVDNLTAVLRALGSNVQEHVSEHFEQFRALLTEIDTEHGLAVTHGTKMEGTALGGTISAAASDGEIVYSMDGRKRRYLALDPRSGFGLKAVDRLRVSMQHDGRLVVPDAIAPVRPPNGLAELAEAVLAAEAAPARHHEEDLIADLAKVGRDGMRKTALCGTGQVGADRRKALAVLMITERVTSRPEGTGRGRGERFWLSEFASDSQT